MTNATGWLKYAVLAGWVLVGCAGEQTTERNNAELGTVALPLTTYGSSGVKYQLRNATFAITSQYYYYGTGGYLAAGGSAATAGFDAGGATGPGTTIVSSETDPEAPSIQVELEQGSYMIQLQPGWSLERVENDSTTPVEAQLLTGEWQWAYISPRSTSWVSYQFGIGDRSIWMNGKLNVDIQVYENPDEYYGPSYGGFGGVTAAGGAPSYAGTTQAMGGAIAVGGATNF